MFFKSMDTIDQTKTAHHITRLGECDMWYIFS